MTSKAYTPTVSSIILGTPSEEHAKELVEFVKINLPVDAEQCGDAVQIWFWSRVKQEHLALLLKEVNSFTSLPNTIPAI